MLRLFIPLLFATFYSQFASHGVLGSPIHPQEQLNSRFEKAVDGLRRLGESKRTKSFTCDACSLAVDGLQALLKQNKTEQELDEFVVFVCVLLQIEQRYVCDRIVQTFTYELYFVLDRVIFTPSEICGAFVADCGTSSNPLFVDWPIRIPGGKPAITAWPSPASNNMPKLRVLHLSDIHIDRQYAEGSEADCETPSEWDLFVLCCRNYPPTRAQTEKDAVKMPAGKWGMPMMCDIPYRTFDSAMRHIAQTEQLDYIIITGDLEAHDPWDYTREKTQANIRNITATLLQYFPRTPIYEAIGNHEGVPQDAMAPHRMAEYDIRGPDWLYGTLAEAWGNWLPPLAVYQTNYRASYAIRPYPGLKIVSLNTVYCSMYNFYLYINQVDPDNTMQWLIEELIDSETRGEKVHIISHIPAGDSYCLKGWAKNFYDVVNRFEKTIAAQFYGHTHQDHFQVYYDDSDPNGRPTHFNFIAPSITTGNFNMPSYRIYTIDGNYSGSTWHSWSPYPNMKPLQTVLDAETYVTNLTAANTNNGEPEWSLEYNMREVYGMPDLSPESWNTLIERLYKDNDLFDKFLRFYSRNGNNRDCDGACRRRFICGLKTAKSFEEDRFCQGL